MNEETVKLNDKELTESQFTEKKEQLEKQKGVQVVRIQENEYKTRLQD